MDTFNFVASLCSILGFIISIITVGTVIRINNKINIISNSGSNNKINKNKVSDNSKIIGGNEINEDKK